MVTCGNLALGAVGSHNRPVATPLSPHRGLPSSPVALRGLRADQLSDAIRPLTFLQQNNGQYLDTT